MFIAISTYKKPIETVDLYRPSHVQFIQKQIENKRVIMTGRQNPPLGGVIVFNVKTKEQVESILQEDPYIKADLAKYQIIEFNPGLCDEAFEPFLTIPAMSD